MVNEIEYDLCLLESCGGGWWGYRGQELGYGLQEGLLESLNMCYVAKDIDHKLLSVLQEFLHLFWPLINSDELKPSRVADPLNSDF